MMPDTYSACFTVNHYKPWQQQSPVIAGEIVQGDAGVCAVGAEAWKSSFSFILMGRAEASAMTDCEGLNSCQSG